MAHRPPLPLASFALAYLGLSAYAQQESASSVLPVLPLALRSPYLNIWLATYHSDGTPVPSPGGSWPVQWTGKTVGWGGLVRVDEIGYEWAGSDAGFTMATTQATSMTPTRTKFTVNAGPVQLTLTYLSPVEPSDWVRQSFPFTYLSINVSSTDGQPHSVQLYSDFSGELLSDNNEDLIQWNSTQTTKNVVHSMERQTQQPFGENNNYLQGGTVYFATSLSNTTWQSGIATDLRNWFKTNGSLNSTQDTNFRRIEKYSLRLSFMNIGSSNSNFQLRRRMTSGGHVGGLGNDLANLFACRHVREPAIQRVITDRVEVRSSYFWTQYSSIGQAIDAFLDDFQDATQRANKLDNNIMAAAGKFSAQYADLVAFALRPAFAAMDITVSRTPSNNLNPSDVKVFMKDVGDSGRINPVDTLYAAFPAFLYLNATLAGHLLEPLLEFQSAPLYHNPYAAPDLGTTYPNVKGNVTDQTTLGVENSGSMLIMVLAHARKSGDGTLIQRYYKLLKRWADFLVTNSLNPDSFTSADVGVARGGSNLALKGITGIYATSVINQLLEQRGASSSVTSSYKSTALGYAQQWQKLAFSSDHITSIYGAQSSWGMLYNAFASKLLNASVVDEKVLASQAVFYASQSASSPTYGFPYDTSVDDARSDWTMFTAAAMPDPIVRDALISMVHSHALWTRTNWPWSTQYDAKDGITKSGYASPAHGAMYALLAQNMPDQAVRLNSLTVGESDGSTKKSSNKAGAIVGVVIGGLATPLGIIAGFLFWRRRRSRRRELEEKEYSQSDPFQSDLLVSGHRMQYSDSAASTLCPLSNSDSSKKYSPVQANAGLLSKAQLFGLDPQREASTSVPLLETQRPGTNSSPGTGSASGVSGRSLGVSITMSGSQNNTTLRNEVEELRREMAVIRQAQQPLDLPPPEYSCVHE